MSLVNPLRPIDDRFRQWQKYEIYVGPNGPATAKYVPNVNDMVLDWDSGLTYRVTAVNEVSLISTLQIWTPVEAPEERDRFIGSLPHYLYSVFSMYVNKNVFPHTVSIDNRVRISVVEANYCKVFRGNNLSENGDVISRNYDGHGAFTGTKIALTPVVDNSFPSTTIKRPVEFYTNATDLLNGADCTLVVYNSSDEPVLITRLNVIETDFIVEPDAAKRHITNIHLESPFLDPVNDTIYVPTNLLLTDIPKFGVVTYSDNSRLTLPVDDTKFTLHGMDDFIPSIPGAQIPLVLVYKMASNEANYMMSNDIDRTIVKDLWLQVKSPDGTYGVKLFVCPVWNDAGAGEYELRYYLHFLDRDKFYNVTSLVELNVGSNAFDPTLYVTQQLISVNIDLSRISSEFLAYRHVQTFTITLAGSGRTDPSWEIRYENGQPIPAGRDWAALKYHYVGESVGFQVDLTCGASTPEEWLNKVYWPSKPMRNLATEGMINIIPTHVRLRLDDSYDPEVGEDTQIKTIAELMNPQTLKLATRHDGEVVFVDFLKQHGLTFLELGTAGLPIKTHVTTE